MQETAIEEFEGTERVYLPSKSVITPVLVLPTTKTAAPITGTPAASVTVPLIGLFCAESSNTPPQNTCSEYHGYRHNLSEYISKHRKNNWLVLKIY